MDKQQARRTIKDTFENPFDKKKFISFIRNLLNKIEVSTFVYKGNYIPDAYKPYIKTLERIGKFNDGENNIDILIVTLKKDTSLERARTMQRNFIAWYLNGSRGGKLKDGALVAFVSSDVSDWRFSLIKMDYKYEQTKSGRMKVKEEFTPARRWSFLVGSNEKSHTAQSRFLDILANDEQGLTLQEIEQAFDIETITNEFFIEYRRLFLLAKEELDKIVRNNSRVKAEFESKGVDTVDFAKKLLGQIVFLYFLQKKGWFGVGRNEDWGNGSKQFLRELFIKKHGDYNNYYNDILEPLFYEALRIDRSHDDHYYSRFNCKIPFLNGGLFDPMGNYDWVRIDITLPNEIFSNANKTKAGDIGDGILDIFDRFNFTVKEDEPLEKEVAIDPELLGKAYEKFNAIRSDNYDEYKKALKSGSTGEENKFNKKYGVYYTPREIVHYMCQQSLINYLTIELNGKANREDIETLIQVGEHVTENETDALIKEKLIKEGEQKTTTSRLALPESIRKNVKMIDQKLADITVCDPAVGSGAFPVGMMNEIIRARNVLSVFLQDEYREPYNFKRQCIEHSLYGVDIDPGAVEITKLRLWLSLIVDENDIKNVKPLPNLDYRIMQGNSLVSEFMGIGFNYASKDEGNNLLIKDEVDELIERFQQKKNKFLNESNVSQKTKLKDEINNLLIDIFESKLKTEKAVYFKQLKNVEVKYAGIRNEIQRNELIKKEKDTLYKKYGYSLEENEQQLKEFISGKQIKPFFLWELYFSEVFNEKDGFDVVIANPPYIAGKSGTFNSFEKHYYNNNYEVAEYQLDTYILFTEMGFRICKLNGVVTFIMPNTWLANLRLTKIRKFLLENSTILNIVMNPDDTFKAAVVDTVILISMKGKKRNNTISIAKFINDKINEINSIKQEVFYNNNRHIFNIHINNKKGSILLKIEDNSLRVKDLCFVNRGVHAYRKDGYGKSKFRNGFQTEKDYIEKSYHSNKKLDKTYFREVRGKNILPYYYELSDRYISWGDWLAEPREWKYFSGERIYLRKIVGESLYAAYVNDENVADQSVYIAKVKNKNINTKFLLSILNSKLLTWYFRAKANEYDKLFPQIKVTEFKELPIRITNNQEPFIILVDRILKVTCDSDYINNTKKHLKVEALRQDIDKLIYKLYKLSEEEIKLIEDNN